ncbi:MAG TPA: NAD(P)-dependent oxidoreductase [Pirellulales bacterium]|nr:NAD(P)-dependent oxidoreductase [Pirellulales bacterium]
MPANDLPASIETEAQLEELLSRPTQPLVEMFRRLAGDILVLGASGKMGKSLARMAKRASDLAGSRRQVFGAARFADGGREELELHGIETIACDLLDEEQIERLPDAANIVYMVSRKFGSTGDEPTTWAMNAWLPTVVCRRYRGSRMVVFSTGNVYALSPAFGRGSCETDLPQPVGEYGMSCLGRERLFEFFSRSLAVPTAIIRLNYACDLRYGVLVDLAQQIARGQPVDLAMGHFNTIWQGDANAVALAALDHVSTPPWVVNVTGLEVLSVRSVCQRLGQLLGKPVQFVGSEAPTALLSDASQAVTRLGRPTVSTDRLIEWVAAWIGRGGRTLNKPTHFESRSGQF